MHDDERARGVAPARFSLVPRRRTTATLFAGVMTAGLAFTLGCTGPAGGDGPQAPAALGTKNHAADVDENDDATESDDPAPTTGRCAGQGKTSFVQARKAAGELDDACLPEISRAAMSDAFRRLRDTRLGPGAAPDSSSTLIDGRGVARRLPWLLADNGCQERAPGAVYLLHAWGFPSPYYARAEVKPGKSLHLDSPNFDGEVTWSGHVAPVYRSEGEDYVLDPAVEPAHPITVKEWLNRITYRGSTDDLWAAFCRDAQKGDDCFDATPRELAFPLDELLPRLDQELRLQQVLGRDPDQVLGACPPWASCYDPSAPAVHRDRAPVLKTIISWDHGVDWVSPPFAVVGENFGDFTTVRVVGAGFDDSPPVVKVKPRVLQIEPELPSGRYQVTVFNGELASQTLTVNVF